MQLQLYALPVSGPPQGGSSFAPSDMPPSKLNCLLQASRLPQGTILEVRINDTLKRWQEGSNQVFSWELQEYAEEIHIRLRTDATEMASWRGIWKGNAIFHLGALPIRVFFNGIEQPLVEASAMIPIFDASSDPFPGNGRDEAHTLPSVYGRAATLPLSEIAGEPLQSDTETGEAEVRQNEETDQDEEEEYIEEEIDQDEEEEYIEEEEDRQEGSLVLEQDPLVLAEEQRSEPATFEEGAHTSHAGGEESVREEEALPTALSNAESLPPQQAESPNQRVDDQEGSNAGKVAAFHADPTWASRTLEHLKALLAMMPKKTVIIDLREPARARQKEEYHPLSRAHLRDDFGGRYWDRSQYIKTIPRSLPATQQTMGRRWERVVSDVDNPDGLPYLEKYVRAGYSMIFMDSIGRDEESARRAVITALQKRIPDLEDMTLAA